MRVPVQSGGVRAAVAVAVATGLVMVIAGAALADTGGSSSPYTPGPPARSVALTPSNSSSPAAGPRIICDIYLGNYVHYSAPGKDTSWHWTWSCDEPVHLSGTSSLFDEGYRVTSAPASGTGVTGNENVRYDGCVSAYWYGYASWTFTAPGNTPASGEGGSPTNKISCP